MKGRIATLVMLVLLSPTWSWAADTSGCEAIVNKFFDLIATNKTAEGVEFLYHTNPWSDKIADTIQQVKTAFASTVSVMGNYRGNTLILKQGMGDRLVYLYYLIAYDRQPLKFEFHCYKPGDKWVIQNFAYSDKVIDDLRDFARYGRPETDK